MTIQIKAVVLTISDSGSVGERTDLSGPEVVAVLATLNAEIVATEIIPDDRELIASRLRHFADSSLANLIVTTGGTGLSQRDVTPEATRDVIDREAPGLAEMMRAEGIRITPLAALSRAVCGTRGRTLIINLPGSVRGARENLTAVSRLLPLCRHASFRIRRDRHVPLRFRDKLVLHFVCVLTIFQMAICSDVTAQQQRPRLRPVRRDYLAGKFLVIPPDGRAISAQIPRLIAKLADHDLVVPPADLLGDLERPGKPDQIVEWARRADYADVEGVVISIEMLVQGGAKGTVDETKARSRLTVLDFIRDQRRGLPIYALVSDRSSIASLAIELTGSAKIDFLLICRNELQASEGEPANRQNAASLTDQITRRGVASRVTVTATMDSAPQLLVGRLLNHRFGITPKIWIGTSRSPQAAGLAPLLLSQINALDGVALPGTPDAASRSDIVLLVNAPETEDEGRHALLETAATAISKGFRVALADMVEGLDNRAAMLADLRKRKMMDQLVAYSASLPPESACATVLAQATSRLITMKFLRDDVERLQRAERAQVELMLTRMLSDIVFGTEVRPKLEALLREQLKADPQRLGTSRDRAETFARDEITRLAEEAFREQYFRNTHGILLSTGERAIFEVRALQRVQLRFGLGTIDDVELRAGAFLPLVNIASRESGSDALWELQGTTAMDDRVVRRFESINWPKFKVDVEQVAIQINFNRREMAPDAFSIQSRHKGKVSRRIEITSSTANAAFYALCRLEQLGAEGKLAEDFLISESPAIAVRGALEDTTGVPWSHRDRLDFVRFLGRAKLNRFYMLPSGEPLLNERWGEPFSENDVDRFRELLHVAQENFVSVVFGFKLGRGFDYSNHQDFQLLAAKLNALRGAGARHFILDFRETDPSRVGGDRLKALAVPQGQLASRILEQLRKTTESFELSVIPAVSTDSAARSGYLRELDSALPVDISIALTRSSDPGATATSSDWRELTRHRPIVIDTFSSNEASDWRPFLGAKNGSPFERLEEVGGVIGQSSNHPHVAMIPLATLGDYLWDPRTYNATRSLDVAIKVMFDDRSGAGVRHWTEIFAGSSAQAHLFEPLFKKQPGDVDLPEMERSLNVLEGALDAMMMDRETALTRAELGYFVRRSRLAMRRLMNDPSYERLPDAKYRLRAN